MQAELGFLAKARFYSSVAVMYAVTLLFVQYVFHPLSFAQKPATTVINEPVKPFVVKQEIIAGKPNRIVVPRLGVDLKVEDGFYDQASKTWTLSGYNAHFAMPTMLANDTQGVTFIYGHNNPYVFGPLKNLKTGDEVQLFTDAGHTFFYSLEKIGEVKPEDTTVFNYEGPPTLVLQTCSGNWNEKRQLFTFKLVKVDKRG